VRTAIISDIHGNLEAFHRVLEAIDARNVNEIICLGDILGYGPDPAACADLVAERCSFSLMGNHDYAVLYEPTNFNEAAKLAAYWTREQIDGPNKKSESDIKRIDFLNRLRVRWCYQDRYTCVHGTVRKPINEYLFSSDPLENPLKVIQIFERIEHHCLVGHTHVPGIFTEEPEFYPADELGCIEDDDDDLLVGRFPLEESEEDEKVEEGEKVKKAIVNPGSVGQPRDHDPRASFAILDTTHDHSVSFYRVEYDIETVASRILDIDALSPWLAERLFKGV
jgi:predicted phosphodiesterase